jgi:HTH-type transcriptional regulator / antitoxin HigA
VIAEYAALSSLPKSFDELCRLHPPRPIADDADYEQTAEIVDRLATITKLSRGQSEFLETLSILIEKYDRDHYSEVAHSTAIQRLKRLMDNHDMTASDLGRIVGNRSLGAAILRGDRQISKANAIKLAEHFKVSTAAFIEG